MKLAHMPVALAHSPWFTLRNARRMLAHTFTGTTLRSILGLESDRIVFERFRADRARRRTYLELSPRELADTAAHAAA
jgi:hypothetical protein